VICCVRRWKLPNAKQKNRHVEAQSRGPTTLPFHGAKLFHAQLLRPGSSKPNVGEHENLIHQLRYPDTRMDSSVQGQSKVAGGMLLRLRPMRIRADYRLTEAIGIGDMSDAIELAAQLLDICDPKT